MSIQTDRLWCNRPEFSPDHYCNRGTRIQGYDKIDKLLRVTSLQMKPKAGLAVMANRWVSISIRPLVKAEVKRQTKTGVFEPVEKPTLWVSQLVTTNKKDGSLRICLDSHKLNKALFGEHNTMPILDMKNVKIFIKAGYWHVKLVEASSDLTIFQTYFGQFRWLILSFSLNSVVEIF